MPFHLYRACKHGDRPQWFGIRVAFDEDHWVSTCVEIDDDGRELRSADDIAPRFFGVTAGQAHRRMVDVLEDTFDEVVAAEVVHV